MVIHEPLSFSSGNVSQQGVWAVLCSQDCQCDFGAYSTRRCCIENKCKIGQACYLSKNLALTTTLRLETKLRTCSGVTNLVENTHLWSHWQEHQRNTQSKRHTVFHHPPLGLPQSIHRYICTCNTWQKTSYMTYPKYVIVIPISSCVYNKQHLYCKNMLCICFTLKPFRPVCGMDQILVHEGYITNEV